MFKELYCTDKEQFLEYTRINIIQFDVLFSLVSPAMQKIGPRKPLSAKLRLAVTLSYLASGDSLKNISKYYRIGASTIYKVIQETCECIWKNLSPLCLAAPSVKKWNEIAEHFYNRWNLPNCVGSIDGKHIRIQCPPFTGSENFNYKKFFSTVLMACCDANYCFTWVEVGDYGSLPDSSIFANSGLGKALETGSLNLPPPKKLPDSHEVLPHSFVESIVFMYLHETRKYGTDSVGYNVFTIF
ncbi:uncharacterized protein [Cardiocondyla obscurior]|uniref:uncharacterized protein n=1 Tax=Cardiocondyla obscurior TaxID=286306 RepID=UPI003965873D